MHHKDLKKGYGKMATFSIFMDCTLSKTFFVSKALRHPHIYAKRWKILIGATGVGGSRQEQRKMLKDRDDDKRAK